MNDQEHELYLARQVSERSKRFWRDLWRQIIVGFVAYGFIAGVVRLYEWSSTWGTEESASRVSIVVTLTPGQGTTILGILAALVIALNLAVWTAPTAGSDEVLAHARQRNLAVLGAAIGHGSILVGAAVVVTGAPARIELASIALLFCALVIAAVASDSGFFLGKEAPVQRRIPEVDVDEKIEALERVSAQWESADPTLLNNLGWKTARDFAVVVLVAALPALSLVGWKWAFDTDTNAWTLIAQSLGVSAASAAIAIYAIFWTARSYVTRDYDMAVFQTLMAVSIYLIVTLTILLGVLEASGIWSAFKLALITIAIFAMPVVMVVRGLKRGSPARWFSARTGGVHLHMGAVKRIEALKKSRDQREWPAPPPPDRSQRLRVWAREVTGSSPENREPRD